LRRAPSLASALALGLLLVTACRPSTGGGGAAATKASASSSSASAGLSVSATDAAPALGALEGPALDLWTRAKAGDADDLARLADHEGAAGLVARASEDATWRLAAIRAMAFVDDPGAFEALPLLARAARTGDDAEATAALESAGDLAARPRRAVDPEDAAELREGCDLLLALAKDTQAPRPRRIACVRALRMLADRGCVKAADLPTDLDAR
jgi:hypothetical protein